MTSLKTEPALQTGTTLRQISAVPFYFAAVVSSISVLILIGWAFEIDFLKRIIPGYVMMNPVTAAAFILSSITLLLLQSADARRVRLAQTCAAVVLLVGFIKLCELIGLFNLGIDQILFRDQLFDKVLGKQNQIAPNTALNFFLTGAAFLLYKVERKSTRSFPAQNPAILVILTSFVAIIAYLYGATAFYLYVSFNPMAIHTAFSFLLLAGGLLLSKPERGILNDLFNSNIGGQAARRLFPLVIVVPAVLGWLRLYGEKQGFYALEMGTAMMIVTIIAVFSAIVIYNARLINKEAEKLVQTEAALNDTSELLGLLSESEKNFRQLADAMPQIVWTARPDGFLDYYNQRWFDYTGMTLEQTEGWGWEPVLHPDDLENCVRVWSESVRTGDSYQVEYRFKRFSDDAYRWHLGRATPVRDESGEVVKWFGTCTDIHEQKRAEEELRQIKKELESRVEERTQELSRTAAALAEEIEERKIVQENLRVREERFQFATRATNDVVWDWNLTTNDLLWNQNFQQLFGYSLEETGTDIVSWTSRLHPDDLHRVETSVHHAIENGEQSWTDEYRFQRFDGSYAFVVDRGYIVYDKSGKPLRMIGSMMDVTERRLMEESLRESELKFRSVTESANDAIVAADGNGNIISWNNGAKRIFGYTDEEALNKPLTVLMPEVYREAHRLGTERHNQTGEAHVIGKTVELIGLRKDTSEFPLELSLTTWTTGKERFYSGIIRDITERRRAEEKLKNFAAQLERSNAELQDFASVASHDLQEPLRKVQAFGERLKSKYGDSLNEEGRDYLERMQNAAGRMQTLINDLLILSRVTTQKKPFTAINLRGVADEVLSDLETRIETTNGTIEIGELPTIEADPTQMRQLLQNLIGNALKFNRPGVPPVVKISGQLCHNLAADNDETPASVTYCLTVEDNGIGFEDKYVEKIFKVFQRLHGRSEYEGTGIGLAVCRKIAERHGGKITARSVPGEGTTFTVVLPVKQQEKNTQ